MTPEKIEQLRGRAMLTQLRRLGVVWPRGRAIPTYTARMTDDQRREADALYDAMPEAFIDVHGARIRG